MTIKYFTDIIQPSEITKYLNLLIGGVNNSFSAFQTVGTWVPFFFGSSTAGSPTYSLQVGSYEHTGRLVTARFAVLISAIGGMAGNLQIGGLPFPEGGSDEGGMCFVNEYEGWTGPAGYTYFIGAITGSTIVMGENGSGVPTKLVPISELTAPVLVTGLCNYHT